MTNALYANSPMLLLGGRNPLALEGMGSLQDAPQVELLRPVAHAIDVDRSVARWVRRPILL